MHAARLNHRMLDDKPRSVDPGRTAKLRTAFRADADMQLNKLRAMLRQAVVDINVIGLSGPSNFAFMTPAARLNQFAGWLEYAVNASLDARWWAHPWIDKATQHGLSMAQFEMQGAEYQPIPTTFEGLHQMAHDELRGIGAALVQKVMRVAHSSIARHLKPHQAFRELVKPINSDIRSRLQLFAHGMTVKSHVHGKAAYYRHHGVTHVGINPELRVPKRILQCDAVRHAGPGERSDVNWVLNVHGDAVPCDACEEMAADGPYTLDEIADLFPYHPNCQCDLVIW